MNAHDVLFVALAFLSEITGTLSGFGSSTFFVPVAVLLEPFRLVLALTALLHCFGNLSKILLFRRDLPKALLWKLGAPSIIFAGIGAFLSSSISTVLLTKILGGSLVLLAVGKLSRKSSFWKFEGRGASAICALSGLMTGLVGTGGAIRGMALAGLHIEKNAFVALSAGIDIGGDFLRAAIYLKEGYMDWKQWAYIPALGLAAVAGTIVGKKILGFVNQEQFESIVSVFVLLSGLAMLFG